MSDPVSSDRACQPIPLFQTPPRRTRQGVVRWGDHVVTVGGDAPVRVQSMTNTDTADAIGTAIQVKELAIAGSELVRITVNNDEAAKAVPIIGIDSGADSKAFTSFLTTDNVQGGRIAADGLAAAIKAATGKEEGEVAIITSLPGVGSLDQRREGFLDQMKTKYPGITVTVDRFADGQATTGLNMMTDLITANPNIVGVFASNLIMAQGVGQAIAENKLGDKIKVIGFDSDEKTVGFLKEGVLAGLVVQDPYRMGYDGVKTALAVSKGEKVETFVDTGANLVTQANMADPKIVALLNPKVN